MNQKQCADITVVGPDATIRQKMYESMGDTRRVTLDILQEQLKPWQAYNFGMPDATFQPLLGMIEEVGETAAAYLALHKDACDTDTIALLAGAAFYGKAVHAHLKRLQSIRGTDEEHENNLMENLDNTSMIITALRNSHVADDGVPIPEHENDPIVALDYIGMPKSKDTIGDGMADSLVYHADFANRLGVNLTDELDECWKKVRTRDWVIHRGEAAYGKPFGDGDFVILTFDGERFDEFVSRVMLITDDPPNNGWNYQLQNRDGWWHMGSISAPMANEPVRKTLAEIEADEARHLEDIRKAATS